VERYCDLKLESGWQVKAIEAAKQTALAAAAAGAASTSFQEAAGGDAGAQAAAGAGDAAVAGRVRTSNCSVYLASDEPAVAAEIRQKYRHIHLIVNEPGLKAGEALSAVVTNIRRGTPNTCHCTFCLGLHS